MFSSTLSVTFYLDFFLLLTFSSYLFIEVPAHKFVTEFNSIAPSLFRPYALRPVCYTIAHYRPRLSITELSSLSCTNIVPDIKPLLRCFKGLQYQGVPFLTERENSLFERTQLLQEFALSINVMKAALSISYLAPIVIMNFMSSPDSSWWNQY